MRWVTVPTGPGDFGTFSEQQATLAPRTDKALYANQVVVPILTNGGGRSNMPLRGVAGVFG